MTAAVGCVSLAQEHGKKTLADCPSFRSWCGADNQADALGHIFDECLPKPASGGVHTIEELQRYRPCAIFFTATTEGLIKTGRSSIGDGSFGFSEQGALHVLLMADVPPKIADDPAELDVRFKNLIGQIMDDLSDLAGKGGYLACRRIIFAEGPMRSLEEDIPTLGDYQVAELRLEWTT